MKNGILTAVLAAALSFAAASSAQAQNLGKVLVPSGVLRLSADTERSGTTTSTTKQFVVPYAGTVRVRWQIKSGHKFAAAHIAVAGSIAKCSGSTLSLTYDGDSCLLFVVAGDLVQVTVHGEDLGNGEFALGYMRNVRLYYNVVNSPGTGSVLND
jgi:hypothetical protein